MKKKVSAMFTVEALLVTSIVILALWGMLFFVFHMHDCAITRICAYDSSLESVFSEEDAYKVGKINREHIPTFTIDTKIISAPNGSKVKYTEQTNVNIPVIDFALSDNNIVFEGRATDKMNMDILYAIKVIKDVGCIMGGE